MYFWYSLEYINYCIRNSMIIFGFSMSCHARIAPLFNTLASTKSISGSLRLRNLTASTGAVGNPRLHVPTRRNFPTWSEIYNPPQLELMFWWSDSNVTEREKRRIGQSLGTFWHSSIIRLLPSFPVDCVVCGIKAWKLRIAGDECEELLGKQKFHSDFKKVCVTT